MLEIVLAIVLFLTSCVLWHTVTTNIQDGSSYNLCEKRKTHGMIVYRDKTPGLFWDAIAISSIGSLMILALSICFFWDGVKKLKQ